MTGESETNSIRDGVAATMSLPGATTRTLPPSNYLARGSVEGVPNRVTDVRPIAVRE